MSDDYRIGFVEHPAAPAREIIERGLAEFNEQQVGDAHWQRFGFAVYTSDHEIVGGVVGEISWNWLFIELLWIRDDLRHLGYGHELLVSMEEEARRRGAKKVHLDTFTFQAPEFYKQHGYRVFGELEDVPPGHKLVFLTKEL